MENEEKNEDAAPEVVDTDDMSTDERDVVIEVLEEELGKN